ncbi:hypothetical protein K7X08_031891 [Anisodus acutangulus]|uniref:Uncharacterized protein n=1 Tax=Anisodus acutangulus TaxID=402998 RepID=A0A9Q1MN20_9SOLA|nr:hypothetical protein K7X08_031891 [Anisodus acutangulus]
MQAKGRKTKAQGRRQTRGRGRPKKVLLATFGSSVGTRIQPTLNSDDPTGKIDTPAPAETGNAIAGLGGATTSGVSKRLTLTLPQFSVTPSSREQEVRDNEGNGTVKLGTTRAVTPTLVVESNVGAAQLAKGKGKYILRRKLYMAKASQQQVTVREPTSGALVKNTIIESLALNLSNFQYSLLSRP